MWSLMQDVWFSLEDTFCDSHGIWESLKNTIMPDELLIFSPLNITLQILICLILVHSSGADPGVVL